MSKQIQLKKTGKALTDKIDFFREITAALLDEVKTLNLGKPVDLQDGINFDEEVARFEIYLIERALEKTGGSQIRAARLLNLKHTTLNAKIKRFQILSARLNSRRNWNVTGNS